MATLVLTAVGTLIGGPIGGAIGAIAGQAIDQEIFKPKGRQGPRLGELTVQTSSYGSAIPKIFGTMRVAGTVIWATDLREERRKSGGGKGRPSTTSYSYSASFAVLLSARAIGGVGRIWADGNLLRGAAGDFKTPTGFRLHLGGEGQTIDPLIASAEGIALTPAYRGAAYAVFEDFQLGDYGNRIPSLSFEIEADPAPVSIAAIVDGVAAGTVGGGAAMALAGFAATGDSVRGVIETLSLAAPMALVDNGERLDLVEQGDIIATLGIGEGGAGGKRDGEAIQSALTVPGEIGVTYYEPARDYQAGLQRARRPGPGRRAERIELPAVLAAGEAKAIAEARLKRLWTERTRRTVRVGWARLGLRPGDVVGFEGETGRWRVAGWTLERMVLVLDLVRSRSASVLPAPAAEPGRGMPAPDFVHGPTTVHLLDLPSLTDELATTPRLHVAAAGASSGWRIASLLASLDDGASWEPIGATAPAATMGNAVDVLGAGSGALFDLANSVEIELLNAAMVLGDADETALIAGGNLALLGDELIQFGSAVPSGGGHWRLSRLARGRRGTEWAIGGHSAGERFILIEAETLASFDPPLAALGGSVRLMASGVGDVVPAEDALVGLGERLRPPGPVRLEARRRTDGGFDIGWIRRSRSGWRWIDGVDAPLGEERERYRLTIAPASGPARSIETALPAFHYPADEVAADLLLGGTIGVTAAQLGTYAVSRDAAITLTID